MKGMVLSIQCVKFQVTDRFTVGRASARHVGLKADLQASRSTRTFNWGKTKSI